MAWNLAKTLSWPILGGKRRPGAARQQRRSRRRGGQRLATLGPVSADPRLESSVQFAPARPRVGPFSLHPRLWPSLAALVITTVGYLSNVQGKSLLDVLPFAWTWLTVWLALTVVAELWSRYGRGLARRLIEATRPRRDEASRRDRRRA
jgi:hypothetical protein